MNEQDDIRIGEIVRRVSHQVTFSQDAQDLMWLVWLVQQQEKQANGVNILAQRDYYKDALEMLRNDAQNSLDHYSARENGGQFVGSPRYPISVARELVRTINHVLETENPEPQLQGEKERLMSALQRIADAKEDNTSYQWLQNIARHALGIPAVMNDDTISNSQKLASAEKEIENLRSQLVTWIIKAGYDPTHSLNEWNKHLSDYV